MKGHGGGTWVSGVVLCGSSWMNHTWVLREKQLFSCLMDGALFGAGSHNPLQRTLNNLPATGASLTCYCCLQQVLGRYKVLIGAKAFFVPLYLSLSLSVQWCGGIWNSFEFATTTFCHLKVSTIYIAAPAAACSLSDCQFLKFTKYHHYTSCSLSDCQFPKKCSQSTYRTQEVCMQRARERVSECVFLSHICRFLLMLTKYPPPHFCTGNNICSKSQVAKYKDFLHCQINTDRLLWLLLRKKERFLFASFFVLSIIQNPLAISDWPLCKTNRNPNTPNIILFVLAFSATAIGCAQSLKNFQVKYFQHLKPPPPPQPKPPIWWKLRTKWKKWPKRKNKLS